MDSSSPTEPDARTFGFLMRRALAKVALAYIRSRLPAIWSSSESQVFKGGQCYNRLGPRPGSRAAALWSIQASLIPWEDGSVAPSYSGVLATSSCSPPPSLVRAWKYTSNLFVVESDAHVVSNDKFGFEREGTHDRYAFRGEEYVNVYSMAASNLQKANPSAERRSPIWGILPTRSRAYATSVTKHKRLGDDACDINTATAGNQCIPNAAIQQANAVDNPTVPDEIHFNILGDRTRVKTIKPTLELPAITQPVIIDGYTQPGSRKNTRSTGTINTVPKI